MLSVTKAALRARYRQYEVERLVGQLQVAEDRLHTIIESAEDYAIINLDEGGHVTYWNAGAERLLGYTEEQILGKSFETIFREEDRRAGVAARFLEEAARVGRSENEGWRVRADGSRFWGSGVLRRTRNRSGAITGSVDVLRDITQRKRAEQMLAVKAKQLERSNADLQRFAYM